MTFLKSAASHLGCGAAAAALCLAFAPITAKATPVSFPTGPGSISGVWTPADIDRSIDRPANRLGITTIDGEKPPVRPDVAKQMAEDAAAAKAGKPRPGLQSMCLPAGFPGMMFGSGLPHQTLESPGQVTILVEELSFFRIIRLNVPHHPDPDPSFFGDSVGHWEGPTLVVDTIGLSPRTQLPGGFPHSDQAHIVERFTRTSKDRIELVMTIEDPKTFTKPWTLVTHLKLEPDKRIAEYYCTNNRNPPKNGATTAVLESSAN